jgi:hypothetical protein
MVSPACTGELDATAVWMLPQGLAADPSPVPRGAT